MRRSHLLVLLLLGFSLVNLSVVFYVSRLMNGMASYPVIPQRNLTRFPFWAVDSTAYQPTEPVSPEEEETGSLTVSTLAGAVKSIVLTSAVKLPQLVVVTQWYREDNVTRRHELLEAIAANLKNLIVSQVHLLHAPQVDVRPPSFLF